MIEIDLLVLFICGPENISFKKELNTYQMKKKNVFYLGFILNQISFCIDSYVSRREI